MAAVAGVGREADAGGAAVVAGHLRMKTLTTKSVRTDNRESNRFTSSWQEPRIPLAIFLLSALGQSKMALDALDLRMQSIHDPP